MPDTLFQSTKPATYLKYTPQFPLASFVDSLWLYENYQPSHTKERRLPDGSMELVINLREDVIRLYDPLHPDRFRSMRGSLLSGPQTEYIVLDTACQSLMIGVHFKPGGAFPFLDFPAGELRDEAISLDILWEASADKLRDQLRRTPGPESRFHIVEQALLAHLTKPLTRHPAVAFALREFQNPARVKTVAEVTEQIGLSPKRFISLFSQEVGLTPKLFCRIHRFQETLHQIRSGEDIEWADIALRCGYFDQAHFIHDFQAFSGLNPGSYFRQQSGYQNHVPLSGKC